MTCYATKTPSTNINAFKNSHIEYSTLIVPKESLDKYKTTSPWNTFGTFKTIEEGSVTEPKKCATPTISY